MNDGRNKTVEWESVRAAYTVQLEQLRRHGVELFVDGKSVLPREAAFKAVRENSPYMADYVLGDSGKIEQVRFDRVTRR